MHINISEKLFQAMWGSPSAIFVQIGLEFCSASFVGRLPIWNQASSSILVLANDENQLDAHEVQKCK